MQNNSEAPERPSAPATSAAQPPRPAKTFPTPGDLFAMLGIVFAAQIVVGVAGVVGVLISGHSGDLSAADPGARGRLVAVTYLVSMSLALGGILYYRLKRGGSGPVAQFSRKGLNPVLLLWAFLFMIAVGIVIEPLLTFLPAPPDQLGRGVWAALTAIVFAPVFEETICRGVVLGSVRAKWGVVAAWLLSSLFFGVLHLQPLLVINAFFIGLILGFIYLATGSLWASIILHAVNNAMAYLLLVSGHEETMVIELVGSRTWYVVIYIAALAVAAVSARMVWRTLARLKAAEKKAQEA
ncbi:lysostaphin resistance A-like protein [Alistipes sp.]|uniref:CPBP family intramembrane glutamic endopeptidase n=1 Tax=Alistipes sp. TaxID=1872444 RepID=UPI003AF12548